MIEKHCGGCGTTKPAAQFWMDRTRGRLKSHCRDCSVASTKAWRKRVPNYEKERYASSRTETRERHLIRKYGVTLADYDRMFAEQGGKCAVCGKTQTRAFDVDHDHATGAVRGLLCTGCNRMIGYAGDSAERLGRAAAYLYASRKSSRSSAGRS